MTINLDRNGLNSLLRGQPPHFSLFNNELIKRCGRYSDQFGWSWDMGELAKLTDEEIYDLFLMCRQSWR